MATRTWIPRGDSKTTPIQNKRRREVQVPVHQKENIVFIGSEMNYDSFWWKMMFVGAAYVGAAQHWRRADRNVVAYVDRGYTRLEKLAIEGLAERHGATTVSLTSTQGLLALLNRERDQYKLQDVLFFCHGVPGVIELNYDGSPAIRLGLTNVTLVSDKAFSADGRIFSYACRTGVSSWSSSFEAEADARSEDSLAAKLAKWHRIEVHAFLRRTLYRDVLRQSSDSEAITKALTANRKTKEGQVIQLSDEHEALPHPDLGGWGNWREGTGDYALWRRGGGRSMPVAADTPTGLTPSMRVFRHDD